MEDTYYLEVYVPMSSKWTIAYIKKAGVTEDNRHAEISTTFPHQAATPKQQMLKWRHHWTKWSTKSNADDRLHQKADKTGQLTDWLTAQATQPMQFKLAEYNLRNLGNHNTGLTKTPRSLESFWTGDESVTIALEKNQSLLTKMN